MEEHGHGNRANDKLGDNDVETRPRLCLERRRRKVGYNTTRRDYTTTKYKELVPTYG